MLFSVVVSLDCSFSCIVYLSKLVKLLPANNRPLVHHDLCCLLFLEESICHVQQYELCFGSDGYIQLDVSLKHTPVAPQCRGGARALLL